MLLTPVQPLWRRYPCLLGLPAEPQIARSVKGRQYALLRATGEECGGKRAHGPTQSLATKCAELPSWRSLSRELLATTNPFGGKS